MTQMGWLKKKMDQRACDKHSLTTVKNCAGHWTLYLSKIWNCQLYYRTIIFYHIWDNKKLLDINEYVYLESDNLIYKR